MRTLKYYFLFYLLCLFVIAGCSDNSSDNLPEKPEEENPETEKPEEEKPEESGDIILNEKTKRLTADFISHVSAPVTGMVIEVDASLPQSLVPQKGDILLNSEVSEKFPYGFLGKVSQVRDSGTGSYLIETEKAALDEAFEKLYVEGTMDVDLQQMPETRNFSFKYYTDGDYKGFEAGCKFDDLPNCSDESYVSFSARSGYYFQYIIDINNQVKKPYASFTLKHQFGFTPDMDVEYSLTSQGELVNRELATIHLVTKDVAGVATSIVLRPRMVIALVAKVDGKLAMGATLDYLLEYVIGVEYKDGRWSMGVKPYPNRSSVSGNGKFSVDGSLSFGLQCEFKANLFSEEIGSASIPFFIGAKVAAELSHDLVESYNYDQLSDAQITFGLPHLSAEATFEMFKGDEEDSDPIPMFEQNLMEKKLHLFPKFEHMGGGRNIQDQTKATVYSTVTQELLLPVEVDYKITSEDGEVTDERNWIKYRKEDDFAAHFSKEFSGLNPAWEYKVVPVVKLPVWGEVEATPEKGIDRGITVTTLTAEYYPSAKSVIFWGGFDPRTEGVSEYGICYSTDGTNPSVDGEKLVSSDHIEGKYYAILQPVARNTTYTFRAYFIVNGNLYYGETKTIKIMDEGVNELLFGKWKLIKNEGECKYDNEIQKGYCLWPWSDLTINADYTMSAEAGYLPRIEGIWAMYGENIWVFNYHSEGETLGFNSILQKLTEDTLVLYCPPNFFNDDLHDPKEQSWTLATFQRMK